MKRKLLFVLSILVWMGWAAAPEVSAMRPACGDSVCQTGSCQYSPPGTSPGDGCEEYLCSCFSDCEGMDPTYASGNDNYCDSCHGEYGTEDCQSEPICTPNWVFQSDTVVGYTEENHTNWDSGTNSWDDWCEFGVLHDVHVYDVNECASTGNHQGAYCWFESFGSGGWGGYYEQHHIPWYGYCCFYYGCSGYQYCPF
jgi:hypothetical protein